MPNSIDFAEGAERYLKQLPLNDSRRIKEKILFLESVENLKDILLKLKENIKEKFITIG